MTPTDIVHALEVRGRVVVRGVAAVNALRAAIDLAAEQLNLSLTFAPGSDPDLVDFLAVATVEAADIVAVTSVIGLLVGALLGRPALGMAAGAVLGTGIGVARAVERVAVGWRLTAVRDRRGMPRVTVTAEV